LRNYREEALFNYTKLQRIAVAWQGAGGRCIAIAPSETAEDNEVGKKKVNVLLNKNNFQSLNIF
jgi:hypothetical protein